MRTITILIAFVVLTSGASLADHAFLARCQVAGDVSSTGASPVVEGRDGWLFFAPELRHLGAGCFWGEAAGTAGRATRADARDPLPAILDLHRALHERGIVLILVPVPPKAVVHADLLFSDGPVPNLRPDPHHQEFYTVLRSHGVTVLDLTDTFMTWDTSDRRGPPYCRQDTHWSGEACVEAARQIAVLVAPLLEPVPRQAFATVWREIEITGDLWRMLEAPPLPKERLPVRQVDGARPDAGSPVVVIGDSHTLVFHGGDDMHTREAGLPDQLAAALGFPVDLIGVRGSGATPARINLFRRAQRDPAYWTGKRVVVWVFSAREFTESDGWRLVPIAP